jgi:MFS family permease
MRPRGLLAFGNFFSVGHFYLIIFVLAPYLATIMPAEETGLVVSAGALATLALFPLAPKLVASFGAQRLALYFGTAEAVVLILLATTSIPVFAIIFAALACAISPLIAYGLDLLLEATVARTEESRTGRVRTAFLTAGNVALIIAPLLVGVLLDSTDAYYRVFLAGAVSLLPFLLLFGLKKIPEGAPPAPSNVRETLVCVQKNSDLHSIVASNFILQCFYHLAPLYIPLYLHNVLLIPWSTLGWMFAVMLLPFVLIEYPAGVLADRWEGDKGFLASGFLLTGLSFALFAFLDKLSPLYLILLLLVASRVGAALIESMTEGHFFRSVSERDTETVSVFRMARPLAALCAPIAGSVLLAYGGYEWLFVVTGCLVLIAGSLAVLGLNDSRREGGSLLGRPPRFPLS